MFSESSRSDDFPPAVRRFIERRLNGIEQLEILLLMHRDASRYWDAGAVAQALYLSELRVGNDLEELGRRGLLDVRIASTLMYRFSPATPELGITVQGVADAYRERRGAVVALLTSRRRALKDFSDAFSLGRDPEDG